MDFGSQKLYRHQVCLYLTLDFKGMMKLEGLILPRYDMKERKFQKISFPFKIEWGSKLRSQSILRCKLVQFPAKNSEINMKLVIQLNSKILVCNMATNQTKSFPLNSQVPILQQHLDDALTSDLSASDQLLQSQSKPIIFYVASSNLESGQPNAQLISQLEIDSLEQAKMYPVLEFSGPKIVRMQQIQGHPLIVMDENLSFKKYKLQSRTMKMKLVDDFRVSEEARKVLLNGSKYTMTNDSLYASKDFFLIMKKQSSNKDS